jgi:hypothetical protein
VRESEKARQTDTETMRDSRKTERQSRERKESQIVAKHDLLLRERERLTD